MAINDQKLKYKTFVIPHKWLVLCITKQGLWFLLWLRVNKDLYNILFILPEQKLLIFIQ